MASRALGKGNEMKKLLDARIKGFVLDVYGVLYDSGSTNVAIKGSIEAIDRLKSAGIPFRLCSNTSNKTPKTVAQTLTSLGFHNISADEIFSPIPAVKRFLHQNKLQPYLIVDSEIIHEFDEFDQSNPNCVVLGDAQSGFTYERLNDAFRLLVQQPGTLLITMGTGKYYKETDGLMLDVGVFAKALEYASGTEAQVIGKPAKSFFMAAVESMNLKPEEVVMIGDDIVVDVGGAQASGIRGIQVRTGKYRPEDEPHPEVVPAAYVNNLFEAVDLYLSHTVK